MIQIGAHLVEIKTGLLQTRQHAFGVPYIGLVGISFSPRLEALFDIALHLVAAWRRVIARMSALLDLLYSRSGVP